MLDSHIKPIHEPVVFMPDEPPVVVARDKAVFRNHVLTYHREVELQYIKQGQGSYFIRDRNYLFQKNSFILIRPNEVHALIPHPEVYIEKWTVLFPENVLDEKNDHACFPADFPCHIRLSERNAVEMEIILRSIEEEKRQRLPLWLDVIRADLRKLILLMRRSGLQESDEPTCPVNQLIKEVVSYIESNFAQELTLNFLAAEFSLSPSYFSRLFKKCTGLNLKQYILQRRIIEAKRLLENDAAIKISSIPHIVGFRDFPVFNQNFKQITGLTPSAYRKIMLKDVD